MSLLTSLAVNDGITIQYNKDKTGESGDGQ